MCHSKRLLRFRLSRSTFLLLLCCGLGCFGGSGLNPVKGKISHKGQPLGKALITFHPKGVTAVNVDRPTAFSKDDGTFTVQTGNKTGAAAGEYVVTIICSEPVAPKKGKKGSMSFDTSSQDTVDRFAGAYANMASSKITVTIKNGANELEPFDLK